MIPALTGWNQDNITWLDHIVVKDFRIYILCPTRLGPIFLQVSSLIPTEAAISKKKKKTISDSECLISIIW